MNILLTDDYSKRQPVCNYTRETTDKVDKIYHDKLFMDTDLVYNPDASSRQFYVLQVQLFQMTKVLLLNGVTKHQYLVPVVIMFY